MCYQAIVHLITQGVQKPTNLKASHYIKKSEKTTSIWHLKCTKIKNKSGNPQGNCDEEEWGIISTCQLIGLLVQISSSICNKQNYVLFCFF